jgi:predicted nuclease with TOPRIM domain
VDAKPFETLEAKVNLVLEKLKSAQAEKGELQKEVGDWRSKYEEAIEQLAETARERDRLLSNQRDSEQEELIKSKISALLAKLEAA